MCGKYKQLCVTLVIIVFSLFCILWCSAGIYYSINNISPNSLTNPRNSRGQVCGVGRYRDKPFLFYLDISECAAIENGVCSTPKICITECPKTYWSFKMGMSTGLNQFCDSLDDKTNISISQLVAEKICPAYIVPSESVGGVCIPKFALSEKKKRDIKKMKTIKKNDNGDTLDINAMTEGVYHMIISIDVYDYKKKILSFIVLYWWNIIITYLSTVVLMIIFTIIFKYFSSHIIWSILILTPILLLYGILSIFMQMNNTISLPTIISSMNSFKINNISCHIVGITLSIVFLALCVLLIYLTRFIKDAIQIISEANESIKSFSTAILILSIQSIVQILVIIWTLSVSISVALNVKLQYKVVNSCLSETCINTLTGKMFTSEDICNVHLFADCTGCPRARCVFNQTINDTLSSVIQCWNLLCMIGIILLIKCITTSLLYQTITRDIRTENLISLLREICNSYKDSVQITFCSINNPSFKHVSNCVNNKAQCSIYIIFIVKILFVGIISVFTFSVVFNQMYYSLDSYINYYVAFNTLIFLSIYIIASDFLNIFKAAIKTYVVHRENVQCVL